MSKYNGNREFKINIPGSVKLIIDVLENNGYEAFAVGGCVRDTILDREPQDWDITTSALPEQVKELFNRTLDTGIQHGTVTVMIKHVGYEVTTYRIDGEYNDSRHPESVEFTSNLIEDLKRRDFTINAIRLLMERDYIALGAAKIKLKLRLDRRGHKYEGIKKNNNFSFGSSYGIFSECNRYIH